MSPSRFQTFLPRPGSRSSFVLTRALSILGILLMGAGLCTGVFCAIAFHQAGQGPQISVKAEFGSWLNITDNQPVIRAYRLLALGIGLFLSGTSVWLWGWGLARGR